MAQTTIHGRGGHTPAAATYEAQTESRTQNDSSKYLSGSTARPAKKAGIRVRMPSEQALNMGKYAAARVKGRDATIRKGFVRSDPPHERPPLARMLVGGQGGEVRLKLYLSMLFIAVAAPYATTFPTRAWAELLDLDSPGDEGGRRVRDAIQWLARNRFVRVLQRPGHQSEVTLLADDGSGKVYVRVSKEAKDIWIKLPADMWSKGWMTALSGRAIAILLVLLDYSSLIRQSGKPFWVPPGRARDLYSLSPETWSRGSAELTAHGLLVTKMEYVKENPFASLRRRKKYALNLSRLGTTPSPGDAS